MPGAFPGIGQASQSYQQRKQAEQKDRSRLGSWLGTTRTPEQARQGWADFVRRGYGNNPAPSRPAPSQAVTLATASSSPAIDTTLSTWTPAVTPGSRARAERMNELSQQAGGANLSFKEAFPQEYAAAQSVTPLVEQYRKQPAADEATPELIDQRSQAYAGRADIAKWIEANRNAPKGADGMNVVDRFLAKQRPVSTPGSDSSVLNASEADRRVAEDGYGSNRFDPESIKELKAFDAGADWAASGMAGMQDARYERGEMEYGGEALRPTAAIEAERNRRIAETGYQGAQTDTSDLSSFGVGSTWSGKGVSHLEDMPMSPATAESNRQINFSGSPLPEANRAQAQQAQADDLLSRHKKTVQGL